MRAPFKVETYCGCCHDTRAHYLKEHLSDEKSNCFECAQCGHLVYAPQKQPPPGIQWYETRKRYRK